MPSTSSATAILTFLRQLWPAGIQGSYLTLTCFHTSWHFADLESAALHAAKLDAQNYTVYFGVGLRSKDLGASCVGEKNQVVSWPGFWIDLDFAAPHRKSKDKLFPTEAEGPVVAEILAQTLPEPSLVIDSGHGLHIYQLFNKPWTHKHRKPFQAALTAYQSKLRQVFDKKHWHLDKTDKLTQVLRLPGTSNRRAGQPTLQVASLVDDGPRYALELSLQDPAPRPPAVAAATVSEVSSTSVGSSKNSNVSGGAAPALAQGSGAVPVLAQGSTQPTLAQDSGAAPALAQGSTQPAQGSSKSKGGRPPTRWKALVREKLERVGTVNQPLVQLLLAGKPFAEVGSRNNTANQLVNVVAQQALNALAYGKVYEVSGQELYSEFFEKSIVAMSTESEPLQQHDVVSMLDRGLENLIELEPERKRKEAEITERILAAKRRAIQANEKRQGKKEVEEEAPQEEPEEPSLTDEEREKLNRRLVIQYRNSWYFMMEADKYHAATQEVELPLKLRDASRINPTIRLWGESANGNERRLKDREVLEKCATLAKNVYFDLTIEESWYDSKTATFYEAAAHPQDLKPEFHPQIDKWLRLLGGAHQEKFLDWIATITRFDLQTACLYISDSPDAGKTMLAQGLAGIWGAPPIDLRLIASSSSFNAGLLQCPLVVADEKLPKGVTLSELRNLIGRDRFYVTRKHLPEAPLKGALRFMILANNRDLLAGDDSDSATEFDVDATAQRFFHVTAHQDAALYLRNNGGREGFTKNWVTENLIAKHALWLRDNRVVAFGRRFAVEGERGDVHEKLLTKGALTQKVFEFLARYITEPGKILGAHHEGFLVGEGKILVRAESLSESWVSLWPQARMVTGAQVATVLKHISIGRERMGNGHSETRPRYWSINTKWVCNWAQEHGIGDPDEISRRVAAPMKPVTRSALRVVPKTSETRKPEPEVKP